MPEGPSLIILAEETADFVGKKILRAAGNSKLDLTRLVGQRVVAIRTWGKHFLIELPKFTIRIHLMLYGRYCINTRKETPPRLSLQFGRGKEMNFYNCSVRFLEEKLDDIYDWSADVMSGIWNAGAAVGKLKSQPKLLVCDAILDQSIFSGAGNIFKNEVLFRIKVHPLSLVGALPPAKLKEMVDQVRQYAFEFYHWKKAFVLRAHWLAHNKGVCPRCETPFTRAYLGKTNRRSFFCNRCQKKYLKAPAKRARRAKKTAV